MKYSITIDNVTAQKWGLSVSHAYLFAWIYTLPSWAKPLVVDGRTYFFASKNKAVEELPLLTTKVDTMYRYYKQLEEMGLIYLTKQGKKDFISLTVKAREWNTRPGAKSEDASNSDEKVSELGSEGLNWPENSPTDNTTILDNTTIDNSRESIAKLLEERKEKFRRSVIEAGQLIYTKKMLEEFFGYWSEASRSTRPKMRFEREPVFEIPRRMTTWATNGARKYSCYLTDTEKTLAQKRKDMAVKLYDYLEKRTYTRDMLNKFYTYWTQEENVPNPQYLRWEKEDFWDLGQRLTQWSERNKTLPNAK